MKFSFSPILSLVLAICLVHYVHSFPKPDPEPKDSTVVQQADLWKNQASVVNHKVDNQSKSSDHLNAIPGRVWCQHSGPEAVADGDCQGHCIRKGYSFGLCISNTCSCV